MAEEITVTQPTPTRSLVQLKDPVVGAYVFYGKHSPAKRNNEWGQACDFAILVSNSLLSSLVLRIAKSQA